MGADLDTGVLVAVLTEDPSTQRAEAYFRKHAPIPAISDFATAELASALGRRVRTGETDVRHAQAAFADLDAWIERLAERIEIGPSDVVAIG